VIGVSGSLGQGSQRLWQYIRGLIFEMLIVTGALLIRSPLPLSISLDLSFFKENGREMKIKE
jgi:hypothetical protein